MTTLEFVKQYNHNTLSILEVIELDIIEEVKCACSDWYDEETDGEFDEYVEEALHDDRMSDIIGGAVSSYVEDYHTLAACYLAGDYSEEFINDFLDPRPYSEKSVICNPNYELTNPVIDFDDIEI